MARSSHADPLGICSAKPCSCFQNPWNLSAPLCFHGCRPGLYPTSVSQHSPTNLAIHPSSVSLRVSLPKTLPPQSSVSKPALPTHLRGTSHSWAQTQVHLVPQELMTRGLLGGLQHLREVTCPGGGGSAHLAWVHRVPWLESTAGNPNCPGGGGCPETCRARGSRHSLAEPLGEMLASRLPAGGGLAGRPTCPHTETELGCLASAACPPRTQIPRAASPFSALRW